MLLLLRTAWRLLFLAGFVITASVLPHASKDVQAEETGRLARIVSIGGDVTEILFALGLGDGVVAVDSTSLFPAAEVKARKNVGYMRALSTEGVLSMSPSLIVASGGAGPPEVVAALKATAVPFLEIDAPHSPDGIAEKVRKIAQSVGKGAQGEALIKEIEARFESLARTRGTITTPRKALFVLSLQNGRAVVAGSNTSANAILQLAGIRNAASDFDGFKPMSPEAIMAAAPDVIVIMRRDGGATSSDVTAAPGFSSSPAAKSGRIIEIDGSYALQFGPRAASAAGELMHDVYPELHVSSGQ